MEWSNNSLKRTPDAAAKLDADHPRRRLAQSRYAAK